MERLYIVFLNLFHLRWMELDVTVIPARGSVGNQARFQANTIASRIANKLNAKLQLLPIPETVSKQAMEIF